MLDHARRKAAREGLEVRFVEADARDFDLGRMFALVFLTGNAFQAFLGREDQERLLATVRRNLSPGGLFAFETRNPSGHDLRDDLDEVAWKTYRNVAGHEVAVSGTQHYDPIAQVMHWTTYRRWRSASGPQCKVTRIACRFTYPEELRALLHYNGFALDAQYGHWDRTPVTATSPSLITLCRARRERLPAAR
jgi:SAM-dependent methyltransferase